MSSPSAPRQREGMGGIVMARAPARSRRKRHRLIRRLHRRERVGAAKRRTGGQARAERKWVVAAVVCGSAWAVITPRALIRRWRGTRRRGASQTEAGGGAARAVFGDKDDASARRRCD